MGNNSKKSVFETRRFKESMKFVYGFGGAIVILGAMFKITHWPGATEMLVAGLTTEALIFIISSFEPLHEDPDWSRVYPELAESEELDEDSAPTKSVAQTKGGLNNLDRSLAAAQIDENLVQRLGAGMQAIAAQAESLASVMAVGKSAQNFAQNLDTASQSVQQMNQINFSGLGENLRALENNIQQVNQVYNHQIKDLGVGLDVGQKTQQQFEGMLEGLQLITKNTLLYQKNMEQLSENLSKINAMYQQVLSQIESEIPETRKNIFQRLLGLFVDNK